LHQYWAGKTGIGLSGQTLWPWLQNSGTLDHWMLEQTCMERDLGMRSPLLNRLPP
jgi:hypothetical protein